MAQNKTTHGPENNFPNPAEFGSQHTLAIQRATQNTEVVRQTTTAIKIIHCFSALKLP